MARILLVDDHRDTLGILSLIVSGLGHETVEVLSGGQALSAFEDTHFDLVLLDYMMPDMDGLDILRAMRSKTQASQLPIFLITAVNDPDLRAQAMSTGATGILAKPVGRADLVRVITEHLSNNTSLG